MKIAISSFGKSTTDLLNKRFGRCEYFQIYDNENNQVKVIENEGLKAGGGAGIAAAQQLVDENIDTLITGNLGPNAFEIIEKSKISAYKSDEILVEDVLEKFKNNQLSEIKIAGQSHHGIVN